MLVAVGNTLGGACATGKGRKRKTGRTMSWIHCPKLSLRAVVHVREIKNHAAVTLLGVHNNETTIMAKR